MWNLLLALNTLLCVCRLQQCLEDSVGEQEEIFGTSSWKLKVSSFPFTECSSWSELQAQWHQGWFHISLQDCCWIISLFTHGDRWRADELEWGIKGRRMRLGVAPAARAQCELSCWESLHQMFPELKSRSAETTYGHTTHAHRAAQ